VPWDDVTFIVIIIIIIIIITSSRSLDDISVTSIRRFASGTYPISLLNLHFLVVVVVAVAAALLLRLVGATIT